MAANKSLNVIFKATDRISAVLDKMNRSIKSNYVAMERMHRSYNSFKASMGKGNLFKTLSDDVGTLRDKMMFGIKPWHLMAGAIGVAYGAWRLFKKSIQEGAKRDAIVASFMPLSGGNRTKAEGLATKTQELSIQTTFKATDIAENVKLLANSMRGDTEKAFATFSLLANTSGGDLDKLNRQVNGFTKGILKQKVTLESLNIIAETGVPIFEEMAFIMYKNRDATGKLFKEISAGRVPLEVTTKAIENLNKKGAMFYQAQEYKAKSAIGQYEQLAETIDLAFGELGSVFLEALQPIMPVLWEAVQGFREFINKNKELIKIKFKSFVDKVVKGLKAIFEYFSENKTEILDKIIKLFEGIGDAIEFVVKHRKEIATMVGLWIKLTIALTVLQPILSIIGGSMTLITTLMTTFGISALVATGYVGLIIAGIVALGIVIYKVWNYWDRIKQNAIEIGATVLMLVSGSAAPFAMLGLIIYEIWKYWDLVTKAFQTDGILGAVAKIGDVIYASILLPIQKTLTALYELSGFDFIKNARDMIANERENTLDPAVIYNKALLPTNVKQAGNHQLGISINGNMASNMSIDKKQTSKDLKVKTTTTR